MSLDNDLYLDVNDFAEQTSWLHGPMAAYADWAGLGALAVLLVLGWWQARYRQEPARPVATAVVTGIAAIVAVLVNQHLISGAIGRTRPCHTFGQAEALLACDGDPSMPSDHCIIAGAFVLGLWVLHRRWGIVAAVLAVLLAFGRVYVGVHYPSDVVVGLLAGALIGALVMIALRRPVTALAAELQRTPLRPLVSAEPRRKLGGAHRTQP